MIISFLKENDEFENRIMLLPEHIAPITKFGFKIFIENDYAKKLNIEDKVYQELGAEIKSASDICSKSDVIIKISGKNLKSHNFKNDSIIISAFFDKSNEDVHIISHDLGKIEISQSSHQ